MRLLEEALYILYRKCPQNNMRDEIVYVMAKTQKDLYDVIIEQEWLGTGHTRGSLKDAGWKARKVGILIA